jgi:hypothetical protein
MPKMTHPMDRGHVVDVADEKVAVYLGQGWSIKSDQSAPENSAVTRAALTEPAPVKKAATKRTAKKAAAKRTSDEA